MALNVGRVVVRIAAIFAIALGFLVIGFEMYRHVIAEGGGIFAAAWFVVAAVLILFGALVLDPKSTAPALHELADVAPIFAPLLTRLASALPGGRRKDDPPIDAVQPSALVMPSGDVVVVHPLSTSTTQPGERGDD